MRYSSDFKNDLIAGRVYERQLGDWLDYEAIEVKRDFKAMDTGNVFIEYFSRGKPSGIAATESKLYCIFLSDTHSIMVETATLKALCRPFLKTRRDVLGGDNNTSKGILLPLEAFIKNR